MTRDQKLIAWFAGLATLAAVLVSVGIAGVTPPPVPSVSRTVLPGPDGTVSLQLVGNTMVGGPLQPVVDQRGYDWPFAGVRAGVQAADFVLAAAEAPITDLTAPEGPSKRSSTSLPGAAGALARAGVDALTLASGQVFDAGPQGFTDTLAHAEAAGLATLGAGPDRARAEQPLLLRSDFGTVGVVALGDSAHDRARDLVPGMTVLSPESIVRGRDLARAAGADWVIAVVHWGTNYETVQPEQRTWARMFAAAGYNLVVGVGPHITQPIEHLGAMPVAYSLGNFVYGTKGRFEEVADRGYGLAVEWEMGAHRAPRVSVRCLVADNRRTGFQPTYCNAQQSAAYLPVLGDLRIEGDRALLECDCPPRRETS
jgi:poly-gamma-glutamate synthesis protein (capsule biosynthesis protein)